MKIEYDTETQYITLNDGRKLAYSEYGNLEGKPCLYFHGYPGSRLQGSFFSETATKNNIRVIAIDRPGVGRSDFKPNRTLLDWPNDVMELANAIGIDKFSVLGISGGGPYAAACAYKIADSLTSCFIVAGLAPVEFGTEGMSSSGKTLLKVSGKFPWLLRPLMWLSFRKVQDYQFMVKAYEKQKDIIPVPDKKAVDDPKIRDMLIKDTQEAFQQGIKGFALDAKLFGQYWGFRLQDISPEFMVHLWHGEQDVNVPVHMGRKASQAIPNCTAKFFPNEGHISLFFSNLDELFGLISNTF